MRTQLLLLLSLGLGHVFAGEPDPALALNPASPMSGEEVSAVVNTTSCTLLPPQATVVRDGTTIRVELEVPDTCSPPDVVPQRSYSIGAFAPGQYTVELYYCSNPPPPLPRCSLMRSITMGVQGTHHAVPTMNRSGLLALMSIIFFVGLIFTLRR
jgi:hypothetical protein